MYPSENKQMKERSPYSAVITREQFLFYETRITTRFLMDGLSDTEIMSRIVNDNLFQYPTERMTERMVQTCLQRLKSLNDPQLVSAIANETSYTAKQICLYAMMKQYRLVWDFMITVVGSKYENRDLSFGRKDLNVFMMRLQEQDDWVASWSETTIAKIKQVLTRILVDNNYLDNATSDHLNPVLISTVLEDAIRSNNDRRALSAFNCLS